jgi:hypothetical protein
MPRTLHNYTIPVPGQPVPGWTPPPRPDDWDEEEQGPWDPQPPIYSGPDPWDGQEPLFRSFDVVMLNGAEQLEAVKAAQGSPHQLEVELAWRSVVKVDGRALKRIAFEDKKLHKACPAFVLHLVDVAYTRHNSPSVSLVDSFLGSHTVTVE